MMAPDRCAVRAISLDLDDTLWAIWPVIDRAEECLRAWLSVHYPVVAERHNGASLRALCAVIATERPDIAHDRTLLRKAALERAGREAGYAAMDVEAAFAVFYAERNRIECYEEVPAALAWLAARYPLVALSNGNADLVLTGVDRWFRFALSAADVGVAKPDVAMFHLAAERLGLPPASILHVGDDPEHDVLGAQRAGFVSAWVNRSASVWPADRPPPDLHLTSLTELVHWLSG